MPLLKVVPCSPLVCKSSDVFKFDVEYEFHEERDAYLAIALHDTKRGGITYDSGDEVMQITKFGKSSMSFEMPLNLFNNGQFRIIVSLRIPRDNDPKHTEMIAFTNDENSCSFVIRDPRNRDYALLGLVIE